MIGFSVGPFDITSNPPDSEKRRATHELVMMPLFITLVLYRETKLDPPEYSADGPPPAPAQASVPVLAVNCRIRRGVPRNTERRGTRAVNSDWFRIRVSV